jgi:RNA polymerase sigma-70 factor (ECF subfamily)
MPPMPYNRPVPRAEDPLDDAVEQMLRGDEDAFRTVYRDVHPRLLRYLTTLVGTTEAEDVVAETWAQAARDLGSFSGTADGFRGWITTIGRHRALDHLRARGRRPIADVTLDELPESTAADDVEGTVEGALATQEALRLIRSLPPEQAEAVLLRAVMGLDAKSAGRVLGRSAGAVRTAAYRGLRRLAESLPEPAAPAPGDTSVDPGAEEVR